MPFQPYQPQSDPLETLFRLQALKSNQEQQARQDTQDAVHALTALVGGGADPETSADTVSAMFPNMTIQGTQLRDLATEFGKIQKKKESEQTAQRLIESPDALNQAATATAPLVPNQQTGALQLTPQQQQLIASGNDPAQAFLSQLDPSSPAYAEVKARLDAAREAAQTKATQEFSERQLEYKRQLSVQAQGSALAEGRAQREFARNQAAKFEENAGLALAQATQEPGPVPGAVGSQIKDAIDSNPLYKTDADRAQAWNRIHVAGAAELTKSTLGSKAASDKEADAEALNAYRNGVSTPVQNARLAIMGKVKRDPVLNVDVETDDPKFIQGRMALGNLLDNIDSMQTALTNVRKSRQGGPIVGEPAFQEFKRNILGSQSGPEAYFINQQRDLASYMVKARFNRATMPEFLMMLANQPNLSEAYSPSADARIQQLRDSAHLAAISVLPRNNALRKQIDSLPITSDDDAMFAETKAYSEGKIDPIQYNRDLAAWQAKRGHILGALGTNSAASPTPLSSSILQQNGY